MKSLPGLLTGLCLLSGSLPAGDDNPWKSLEVKQTDTTLEFRVGGQSLGTYYLAHEQVKRPFFAHLKTLPGTPVTRNFPPVEGTDRSDHPDMHPGVWLAFSRVNGVSFWHNQGKIVHDRVEDLSSEGGKLRLTLHSIYQGADGTELAREKNHVRLLPDPAGWLLTLDYHIRATRELTFGVKEENGLGVRVATPLAVDGGKGTILSSRGDRNGKANWGQTAAWWDYSGPAGEQTAGILLMLPPKQAPCWAHARDYGLLVANPFAVDLPANQDKSLVLKTGETLRLRFGLLIHQEEAGKPLDRAAAWERYLKLTGEQ